jgi:sRNA-binding carbon storage regulator CsrA
MRFDDGFSAGIRFAMKFSCQVVLGRICTGGVAMLVLSRRTKEKVVFPTLGTSIDVHRIAGNRAQLAIAAPDYVPILRHDILEFQTREANQNGTPKSA